jgi:hypothetical protein
LVSLQLIIGLQEIAPKQLSLAPVSLTVLILVAQPVKLYFPMVATPLFGVLLVFPPSYSAVRTPLVAEALVAT